MVKAINRLLLEINQPVYEVKLKLNRETNNVILGCAFSKNTGYCCFKINGINMDVSYF